MLLALIAWLMFGSINNLVIVAYVKRKNLRAVYISIVLVILPDIPLTCVYTSALHGKTRVSFFTPKLELGLLRLEVSTCLVLG